MLRRAFLTALLVLVLPGAASADVRIDGRGWGHGIGLSQYGAYGYALQEGRSFRWILGHYYAGTRVAAAPRSRMRVRLKAGRSQRIAGATVIRSGSRRVRLRSTRTYRLSPWQADGLRVTELAGGRTVARLRGPARATGAGVSRLLGKAENGLKDARYRGAMVFSRDGRTVLAVNDVDLEHYLYGVVPGEMPASWPAEALKAQATVARSYALRSRRSGPWDVFADTRSQVYRGATGEDARATAAVRATRRLAVHAGGAVAQTFFFSTSGGRTAAIEEVWQSAPVSYLEAVEDPYDRLSPYHTWSVTLTDAELRERLESVTPGALRGIAVVATTATGRVATVRVSGTLGDRDVRGDVARGLLGLRSTWFAVTTVDG